MAAGDPFIGCDGNAINLNSNTDLLTILAALLGNVNGGPNGIRFYLTQAPAATIDNVMDCDTNAQSVEYELRGTIVQDAAGNPALHLIQST